MRRLQQSAAVAGLRAQGAAARHCHFRAVPVAEDFAHIPRISIERFRTGSPAARAAEVAAVRAAFQNQGMALLGDTGIPRRVITDCVDRSREFFTLPRERKEHFGLPAGYPTRSYSAITYPRGKAYDIQQEAEGAIVNEWLLVRDCEQPFDPTSAYYTSAEGREFYSPESKHPEQQVWPEEVPGLREATSEYYRHVTRLSNTMYEVFALALGLDVDYFTSRARHGPAWPVTIAHYPKQLKPPPAGTMRIQPHWDRTLFALVTTTDIDEQARGGGIQILVDRDTGMAADGRNIENAVWRNVPIEPDSFVLNVGEMMARWTNGFFKHVVHRVPNPPPEAARKAEKGRISVMAYVLPDYDVPVECLPNCIKPSEVPKYEPTWIGEMMNWGSELPIYNREKQERMRLAQGLYTATGEQVELGVPTDVNEVRVQV